MVQVVEKAGEAELDLGTCLKMAHACTASPI